MGKPPFINEDDLGLSRGRFNGQQLSRRYQDAIAEAQEDENNRQKGIYFLRVAVPAGLVGMGIGGGLTSWVLSFVLRHADMPAYILWMMGGMGLMLALVLIVKRCPGWVRHLWHTFAYHWFKR